jgi:predicted cobalt transporter CbtA
MGSDHLERGALAGIAGGLVYGLYLATVGNSFTAGLETFEHGHEGGAVVSELTTAAVSVGGGVLWGLLFGIGVFGVGYYFFEPALPENGLLKRAALASAGFLTVSGSPWLILPPQPPGVEQALPTETRLLWYGGMMALSASIVGLCGFLFQRTSDRQTPIRVALTVLPLALFAIPIVFAPSNPVHGDVPASLGAAYRWMVVVGQMLLWATIAAVHTRLGEPELTTAETEYPATAD